MGYQLNDQITTAAHWHCCPIFNLCSSSDGHLLHCRLAIWQEVTSSGHQTYVFATCWACTFLLLSDVRLSIERSICLLPGSSSWHIIDNSWNHHNPCHCLWGSSLPRLVWPSSSLLVRFWACLAEAWYPYLQPRFWVWWLCLRFLWCLIQFCLLFPGNWPFWLCTNSPPFQTHQAHFFSAQVREQVEPFSFWSGPSTYRFACWVHPLMLLRYWPLMQLVSRQPNRRFFHICLFGFWVNQGFFPWWNFLSWFIQSPLCT